MERFSPVLLTRGRRPRLPGLPPTGIGKADAVGATRDDALATAAGGKAFRRKDAQFHRRQRLSSAGREWLAGRISRSLAEASVGCVSHLSRPPRKGHSDWPTHGFINCEILKQRGRLTRVLWAAPASPIRVSRAWTSIPFVVLVSAPLARPLHPRPRRVTTTVAPTGQAQSYRGNPPNRMVEPRRIELLTPCVQGRCSPS